MILHGLGMFVADMFKSRHRLEAENLFLRSFSKGQVGLNGEISQAIRAGLASHHLVFFGLKASPKDMRQSVAKLPWIFRDGGSGRAHIFRRTTKKQPKKERAL